MSEVAQGFVGYLSRLEKEDRGGLAELRRSLGFPPGTYPRAFPFVERFVGAGRHAEDPWRKALYLTAGLYAANPRQKATLSFASSLGGLANERGSGSFEQRFVALLDSDSSGLPALLRQAVALLGSADRGLDYAKLLDDLPRLLDGRSWGARDKVRQQWARDFYEALDDHDILTQRDATPISDAASAE